MIKYFNQESVLDRNFRPCIRGNAVVADAGKRQLAGARAPAGHAAHQLDRRLDVRQVIDGAALRAHEMRVGKGVAVITLEPIDDAGGPDDALAPEHGQIAVDRSEGEIRDIRLELRVDPFGGGMRIRAADAGQDRIALSALFL